MISELAIDWCKPARPTVPFLETVLKDSGSSLATCNHVFMRSCVGSIQCISFLWLRDQGYGLSTLKTLQRPGLQKLFAPVFLHSSTLHCILPLHAISEIRIVAKNLGCFRQSVREFMQVLGFI